MACASHSKFKLTHDESLQRVCLLCFRRDKSSMRLLTEDNHRLINEYVFSGYEKEDNRLPKAICGTCRVALSEFSNGKFSRHIDLFDHSLIGKEANYYATRSSSITTDCECLVCVAAHSNCTVKDSSTKRMRGRPRSSSRADADIPDRIKLCSLCLSKIGRGLKHICTRSTLTNNMRSIIDDCQNDRMAEQLTHSFMKDKENMTPVTLPRGG